MVRMLDLTMSEGMSQDLRGFANFFSHLLVGLRRQVLTLKLPIALNGQVIGLGKLDWLCQTHQRG